MQEGTVFYSTDNIVTYFVMQNGSSSSPKLHKLVRAAKLLELRLGCRIEVVHVPGCLMIVQGMGGLSQGMWIAPKRLLQSSLDESMLTLEVVPFSPVFGEWLLKLTGHQPWKRTITTLGFPIGTGVLSLNSCSFGLRPLNWDDSLSVTSWTAGWNEPMKPPPFSLSLAFCNVTGAICQNSSLILAPSIPPSSHRIVDSSR
jgi:hypothetical protein